MSDLTANRLVSCLGELSDRYETTHEGKESLGLLTEHAKAGISDKKVAGLFRAVNQLLTLDHVFTKGRKEEEGIETEGLNTNEALTEGIDRILEVLDTKDSIALEEHLRPILSRAFASGRGISDGLLGEQVAAFKKVFSFNETVQEMEERELGAALLIAECQGCDEGFEHLVSSIGPEQATKYAHYFEDPTTSGTEGEGTENEDLRSPNQKKRAKQKAKRDLARLKQAEKEKVEAEADEKLKAEQKVKRDFAISKQEEKKKKELEKIEAQRKQVVSFVKSPKQKKKKAVTVVPVRFSDSDFSKNDVTTGESSSNESGRDSQTPSFRGGGASSVDTVISEEVNFPETLSGPEIERETSPVFRTINSPFDMPDISVSFREMRLLNTRGESSTPKTISSPFDMPDPYSQGR
jgi:hypothetical protein